MLNFNLQEEIDAWLMKYGEYKKNKTNNGWHWEIAKDQRHFCMVKLLERLKMLGAKRDTINGNVREAIATSCIFEKNTRGASKKDWRKARIASIKELDKAKVKVFGLQSDDILAGKQSKVTHTEETEEDRLTKEESEQEWESRPESSPKKKGAPKKSEEPVNDYEEPPAGTPDKEATVRSGKEVDRSLVKDRPMSKYREVEEDFWAIIGEKKPE